MEWFSIKVLNLGTDSTEPDLEEQYDALFAFEPCHDKTCLQGFQPGPTQNKLYNHIGWLEA